MLSFIKKLFGVSPKNTTTAASAPYKIEAPTQQTKADVTINSAAPAKKPRRARNRKPKSQTTQAK